MIRSLPAAGVGDRLRRLGPARLGALAVLATGALLLLLALAYATVWAPAATTTTRVGGQAGAPVVVTTPEALALDGPSVRVEVRGAGAGAPVFVGVGRAGDVETYLGGAARTEVTGVRGDAAAVARTGTDAALPEPSSADVWALSASGQGNAALTWPQTPGRWRLVAAGDGSAPPAQVVLTWQRAHASSPVPALLAVGVLLLVLGSVGLRVTRRAALAPRQGRRSGAGVPAGVGEGRRQRPGRRAAATDPTMDPTADPTVDVAGHVDHGTGDDSGDGPRDDPDDDPDDDHGPGELPAAPAPFRGGRRGATRLDARRARDGGAGDEPGESR